MNNSHKQLLLVGSIPFETVLEVFERFGKRLGPHLVSMPDGEVGPRSHWISRIHYQILNGHPELEVVRRPKPDDAGIERLNPRNASDSYQFRVRPGIERVRFGDPGWRLGFARDAHNSYFMFRTLRDQGILAPHLRFQVSMPLVNSALPQRIFVDPCDIDRIRPGYEAALAAEIATIVRIIPSEDLAIQWDCATEVQDVNGHMTNMSTDEAIERSIGQVRRLCSAIPETAMLGFHFCFGTLGGWPRFSPADLGPTVGLANAAVEAAGRRVDWIHIPLLDTDDNAFFAPLADLRPRGARVYLGAIHNMHRFEKRMAIASRHLREFGIGAFCGFGRSNPGELDRVLADHEQALALARPGA